jgi:hypothetical protein
MHLQIERRPRQRWWDWHPLNVEVLAAGEGGVGVGDPLPVAPEAAALPGVEVAPVALVAVGGWLEPEEIFRSWWSLNVHGVVVAT